LIDQTRYKYVESVYHPMASRQNSTLNSDDDKNSSSSLLNYWLSSELPLWSWTQIKQHMLSPFFVGIGCGFGISVGRTLFLVCSGLLNRESLYLLYKFLVGLVVPRQMLSTNEHLWTMSPL